MNDGYTEDMAMMDHIDAMDRMQDAYLDSPAGRKEMAAQAAFEEERQYEEWVAMTLEDDPEASTSKADWTDYLLAGLE